MLRRSRRAPRPTEKSIMARTEPEEHRVQKRAHTQPTIAKPKAKKAQNPPLPKPAPLKVIQEAPMPAMDSNTIKPSKNHRMIGSSSTESPAMEALQSEIPVVKPEVAETSKVEVLTVGDQAVENSKAEILVEETLETTEHHFETAERHYAQSLATVAPKIDGTVTQVMATDVMDDDITLGALTHKTSAVENVAARDSVAGNSLSRRPTQSPARPRPTLSGHITKKTAQTGPKKPTKKPAKRSVRKSAKQLGQEGAELWDHPTRTDVVQWLGREKKRKGQEDIDAHAEGRITTEELLALPVPGDAPPSSDYPHFRRWANQALLRPAEFMKVVEQPPGHPQIEKLRGGACYLQRRRLLYYGVDHDTTITTAGVPREPPEAELASPPSDDGVHNTVNK